MSMISKTLAASSRSLARGIREQSTAVQRVGTFGLNAGQSGLEEEFPGLPALQPAGSQPKPETKVTTLSNGLRVATEETYAQASSLSLFVEAGSRFENDYTNGTSHLLEHMAFTSTESRSHLRMIRDVEDIGAVPTVQAGREHIMYSLDVLRERVGPALELLADTVVRPKLIDWEINEQKQVLSWQLQDMESNPQALLTEAMHSAAFSETTPLGRGLYCPERNLGKLNAATLQEFRDTYFTAGRMVLAASGVDHDELVALAEAQFGDLPAGAGPAPPSADEDVYVGGETRTHATADMTHVAIAFKAPGWNDKDLVPLCVLQLLLGGGGSFSAGGPGKGMYSRLYTDVLNRYHWIDSATAFNSVFNNLGMFGIYGTSPALHANSLIEVMAAQLKSVAEQDVGAEELARARNQLQGSMFYNLEMRAILAEDIGRQMLAYGVRETPASLSERIQAVTAADIRRVASSALASPLTLGCFGDISSVPRYDLVAQRFQ